jgi:hypothetical protein
VTVTVATGAAVVAMNVVLVWPAGMVTLAGTVTDALLLFRPMATPPDVAAALMVTVPVTLPPPPMIAVGVTEIEATETGLICNVLLSVVDPKVAEIVTGVATVVTEVVTANDPDEDPAGIVTVAGTAAAGPLLASTMIVPPAGAIPSNVTVPVTLPEPPVIDDALSVNAVSDGGITVRLWLSDAPRSDALIAPT